MGVVGDMSVGGQSVDEEISKRFELSAHNIIKRGSGPEVCRPTH